MNIKCTLILIMMLTMLVANKVAAAPILNENEAVGEIATIYPDHADENKFYVLPLYVVPCLNATSQEVIGSFLKVSDGFLRKGAEITLSICPVFTSDSIERAKIGIMNKNPKAYFSVVPIQSSEITFDQEFIDEVESNSCNMLGNAFGGLSVCSFRVTPRGRRFLWKYQSQFILPLYYTYSFTGILKGVSESESKVETRRFSVPYLLK